MLFKGRRSDILHNFTMDVDRRYKNLQEVLFGIPWKPKMLFQVFFQIKKRKWKFGIFQPSINIV